MNQAETWEWVALVRAVFPVQELDDATVEKGWVGVLKRWRADYAQAAVARVAETMPRWRGLHDFIEAYTLVAKENRPPATPDEPSVEERRASAERQLRWMKVIAAIEAGDEAVAVAHRERTGVPYVPGRLMFDQDGHPTAWKGGWNDRVPDAGGGGRYPLRQPTFAPGETERTLEACEAAVTIDAATVRSRGLLPSMPKATPLDLRREASSRRNDPTIPNTERSRLPGSVAAEWGV